MITTTPWRNWKDIKFPSDKEDWKKIEQNNKEIALNVLFVPHNKKEIELAYTSKYNYKGKKVILLMITDKNNRWYYLAVKRLPALFRGTTSNHHGDFYCLNCFIHTQHIISLKNMKKYVIIMITTVHACLKNMRK